MKLVKKAFIIIVSRKTFMKRPGKQTIISLKKFLMPRMPKKDKEIKMVLQLGRVLSQVVRNNGYMEE